MAGSADSQHHSGVASVFITEPLISVSCHSSHSHLYPETSSLSEQVGATLGVGEWVALVAGVVLGLEVGLHTHTVARL